jgi:hypothetical protein
MVQPQRSGAARNATFDDAASGSDDFDDANSWAGGSPESSMSAYYSPRWGQNQFATIERCAGTQHYYTLCTEDGLSGYPNLGRWLACIWQGCESSEPMPIAALQQCSS